MAPAQDTGCGQECQVVERGFTLLEIMVALSIISGLLITLIYTINYNLGIAERHEFTTVATILAKNKIGELEKAPAVSKGVFPEPYKDYHFTTGIGPSPFPGISEITVIVGRDREELKFSQFIESGK